MVSFIDNIIVKTKEEEEHNKVIEKIIKRLANNNLYLYIKLEKYKVKKMLDWLTPQEVKNIQKFLRLANYY